MSHKLEMQIYQDEAGKVHLTATVNGAVVLDEVPKDRGESTFRAIVKMNGVFENWCEKATNDLLPPESVKKGRA